MPSITSRVSLYCLMVLCLGSILGQAQTTASVSSAPTTATLPAPAPTPEYKIIDIDPDSRTNREFDITFDTPLDDRREKENFGVSNVTIVGLPSNKPLMAKVERVGFMGGSPSQVEITLDSPVQAPNTGDKNIRICFAKLFFADVDAAGNSTGQAHVTDKPVCGETPTTPVDVAVRKAKQAELLGKTPTTSDERNIFASGFVSTGKETKPQGGAAVNLNSKDLGIEGLTAFLKLKKTTDDKTDPKYLELGMNQRRVVVFRRKTKRQIKEQLDIINDPNSSAAAKKAAGTRINQLAENYKNDLFGGLIFDLGLKLETEALKFNVTNFVGESMLQLQSRTLGLGTPNSGMRLRLVPIGFEVGYNLGKPEDSQAVSPQQAALIKGLDWIARYKFGGTYTLYYQNPSAQGLFSRVELELKAVGRYLFFDEATFDKSKKLYAVTEKGFKPWYEANLNLFFMSSGAMRPGFKLSFNRGGLPPVFTDTRTFQYGFVIESTEGDKAEKK